MAIAKAKYLRSIGGPGSLDGLFEKPTALCLGQDLLAVVDTIGASVQLFSAAGTFGQKIKAGTDFDRQSTPAGKMPPMGFSSPSGVFIREDKKIFVTDSMDHFVRIFNSEGQFVGSLANPCGKHGGLQGIACDRAGRVYVSDADNGCVQVLEEKTGAWLGSIGNQDKRPGSRRAQSQRDIELPSGLALDGNERLYVVDFVQARVLCFTKAGSYLFGFGEKGKGPCQFNVPRGIAIDRLGNVYVSDSLNHRVQVFDNAGNWLYAFGLRGREAGQLSAPAGIAVDPACRLVYICDQGNQCVQVFQLEPG